jgi:hypothetical protein
MIAHHPYFDCVIGFFFAYILAKAHNMLVIMLEPHFKNMKIICDFMGDTLVVQIVAKYDIDILCVFLVQVFFYLNLIETSI